MSSEFLNAKLCPVFQTLALDLQRTEWLQALDQWLGSMTVTGVITMVPSVERRGMNNSTTDPARSCRVVAPDTAFWVILPIACNTLIFCSVSVSFPSEPTRDKKYNHFTVTTCTDLLSQILNTYLSSYMPFSPVSHSHTCFSDTHDYSKTCKNVQSLQMEVN